MVRCVAALALAGLLLSGCSVPSGQERGRLAPVGCDELALLPPSGSAPPLAIQHDAQRLSQTVLAWAGDAINTTQASGTGWTARTTQNGTLQLTLDERARVTLLKYQRPSLLGAFTQPAVEGFLLDLADRLDIPGEYHVGGTAVAVAHGPAAKAPASAPTQSPSTYAPSPSVIYYPAKGPSVEIAQLVDGIPILGPSKASLAFKGPNAPSTTLTLPFLFDTSQARPMTTADAFDVAAQLVQCEVAAKLAPAGVTGPAPRVETKDVPSFAVHRGSLAFAVNVDLEPAPCPPAQLQVTVDAQNGAILGRSSYTYRATCPPPPPPPVVPPPPPPKPGLPATISLRLLVGSEEVDWILAGGAVALDGSRTTPGKEVVNATVTVRQGASVRTFPLLGEQGKWSSPTASFPDPGPAFLTFSVRFANGTVATRERMLPVDESGVRNPEFTATDLAGLHSADACTPPPGGDNMYRAYPMPVSGRAAVLLARVVDGYARIALCNDLGALTAENDGQVIATDVSAATHPYVAIVSTSANNPVTVLWFTGYGPTIPEPFL